MSVPYNKQLNLTFDALRGAEKTVESLRDFYARLREARVEPGVNDSLRETTQRALKEFEAGMDDDFNISCTCGHSQLDPRSEFSARSKKVLEENKRELLDLIKRFDSVLAIFGEGDAEMLESEVQALIDARQEARRRRDFGRADEIRDQLLQRGIVLEDTKNGLRWRRK